MPAPEIAVAYVSIVPEIQGFTRELREQIVGPAENAGADAGEQMGGSLKDKLKAGAAAAGVAAGAVLVAGIVEALEQKHIQKTLQAQLGSTEGTAKKHGKIAGELFTSGVTGSFQEAADSIKSVVQAGLAPPGTTNKQLKSIATQASDVAKVFEQDLGGVTNAVSQMLRTGMAKNADEAFDVLTKGFQNGANKADDLLDTFNEYSTQFRKLGLDGKDALGIISQMVKAGARDSDIAADALKEFSILAVDGSKGAAEAYKALGLDAEKMTAQIGKGGDSASAGLQTVIDRLKAMKDPVEREAAAVGLFGTQAEDLGAALFAMDPKTAVSALGQVGGGAKKMGDTLRSGPLHELEVLKRELQQGFVGAITTYVLPALNGLASGALWLADAAGAGFAWLKEYGPWLAPFAVLIGGITLALNAQAIATGIVTGVFAIYRGAMLLGIAVTNGMAIATGLLNAVMALNPFVLIAIAIAAFVAAIVVAYNKVGWFRDLCDAAFKVIGDVVSWLWNTIFKPYFTMIGDIISWLWNTIVKPYFTFIADLAMWLYTAIAVVVLAPLIIAFEAVAAVVEWLWTNAIKPVFGWIADKALWLWNDKIKPAWDLMKLGFEALGNKAKGLWNDYIQPVFGWIGDKAKWLWEKAVKPPFDLLKKGVKAIGDSFTDAKDMIKKQWDKLMDIAKKPVRFIIEHVYNGGIVPLWNKVAGVVGGKKLSKLPLEGFARGGVLPGSSSWRNGDDQLVPMRKGEGVYVSEAMRDPYERARLFAVNKAAMRGQSLNKFRDTQGPQGFAKGGILGSIGSALKKPWDWATDSVGGFLKGRFNSLLDGFPGLDSGFGSLVKGVPVSMFKSLIGYGEKKEKDYNGGPGVKNALKFARSQAGKPYQWAGGGNPSWDCSGFMAGIQKAILGQNPRGRLWSTHAFSGDTAPAGWVRGMKAPFTIGITNAGVGHTAGTLGGVNVESRGGDGVVVGSRARGYNSSMFTDYYGFAPSRKYDSGGWLQPGATASVNKTGKPEPVLTASQWSTMATLAAKGATGGLQPGDTLVLSVDGRTQLEAYVDRRADNRIHQGLTSPAMLGRSI
jgi:phage-related minor tail protein